jgi:hypothetical protein
MGHTVTVTIDGTEYVAIPRADYIHMAREGSLAGAVDAVEFARASIGADLRAAREHAKLTQEDLATKLRKSQTMVSQAEAGRVSVGERYVAAVLKACGLPKDWKPTKRRGK